MKSNQLKRISLFILAKHKHSNSCYYNYNPYKVSKQLGFSPTKWKNQIKHYLRQGWCREEISRSGGRNLVFNKLDQVLDGPLKGLRVRPDQWNARDIHNQLLITILQNSEKQQKFVAKVKSDLTNPKKDGHKSAYEVFKSARKKAKTHGIFLTEGEKADNRFKISVYKLGKLFTCSIGQASKLMKGLELDGLLRRIHHISNLGPIPHGYVGGLEIAGVFCSRNGILFKREVNTIVFKEPGIDIGDYWV